MNCDKISGAQAVLLTPLRPSPHHAIGGRDGMAIDQSIAERFWATASIGAPDECWRWKGPISTAGHGYFRHGGKSVCAHRIAYQLSGGVISERERVFHRCSLLSCVNPAHLKVGFEALFWARTKRVGECIEWQGTRRNGYGVLISRDGPKSAHRTAYELNTKRKIPPGLLVCHHCDNKRCVNPAHLFLGTASDNAKDMHAKQRGKAPHSEAHYAAKLTAEIVSQIRAEMAAGASGREIESKYGISNRYAYRIMRRMAWKHVNDEPADGGQPPRRERAGTKLSEADVLAIRASSEQHKILAERFAVHASHICRIKSGKKRIRPYG
jgi:hypothetical protein